MTICVTRSCTLDVPSLVAFSLARAFITHTRATGRLKAAARALRLHMISAQQSRVAHITTARMLPPRAVCCRCCVMRVMRNTYMTRVRVTFLESIDSILHLSLCQSLKDISLQQQSTRHLSEGEMFKNQKKCGIYYLTKRR